MSKALETQVGGTHYTDLKIQPFELTFANFGYLGLKAAVYTKINKYMTRSKDNEVQQLKKAAHCLAILIEKAQEAEDALDKDRNRSIDLTMQTR